MSQLKYNNDSHCKINGTERSILTALSQTLKLVANPVITGKVPNSLFATCRVNKFNLNIVDWIALMSKLKTAEMMYGIEIKVAAATVFEMQRNLKCPELNEKYIHVKSTHPSDTDDVALRCYHYLWATTTSFEVSPQQDEKTFQAQPITNENTGETTSEPKNEPTKGSQLPDTPKFGNVVVPNNTPASVDREDDSSYDDSDDILPKRNLKETGKTLGKKQIFQKN